MTEMSAAEAIFFAALEKSTLPERAAYLDDACRGDVELRERVERLLAAHPQVGSFMEQKAVASDASRFAATAVHVHATSGEEESEPTGALLGTLIAGRYKLLQQIGEGGMGTVFMAEQISPVKRMVAVKIIKAGMDTTQVVARFEAERQALAMMDHPSIAKVLDAGATETWRPFFVMELVKGVPITTFCDQNQLTSRERLELFVPVCQAIQHAHMKGIIHRDIKPSNVLIALYDGKPVPKVIDFGIAKAAGQKLTERTMFTAFGALVGTLEYMSPEQAELNQLDIDTRSDIYSLGVLLYELLTGTTPLTHQRIKESAYLEILRLIREEDPPRPSTRLSESKDALPSLSAQRKTEPARLTKQVRGELDWIVMKALDKDRSRRYETANGLARDIEHHLNDEAVEACPPGAGYRLRKFVRKHKTAFVTTTAFAALLLLGAIISMWQAVRATRAESQAMEQRNTALAAEQEANRQRDAVVVAELKARTEAQRAKTQAEHARNVKRFISQHLLNVADPDLLGDQNLKMRDLIDQAAELMKDRFFADQPLGEATIRWAIGQSYVNLGLNQEAQTQLEKACELYRREIPRARTSEDGSDLDHEYMNALILLARVYDAQSNLSKVVEIFRTIEDELPGAINLSDEVKREFQKRADGLLFGIVTQEIDLERLIVGCQLVYEARSKRVGLSMEAEKRLQEFRQLNWLIAQKKYAEAEEILTRLFEEDWPSKDIAKPMELAVGLMMLIRVQRNLEKYDEVTQFAEAALFGANAFVKAFDESKAFDEKMRKAFRRDHLQIIVYSQELAYALVKQTKFAQAEAVLRECLRVRDKRTPDRFQRFDAQSMLGAALAGQKKYVEAEPLLLSGYEGLLARSKSLPNLEKVRLTEAGERLVKFYEAQGNKAKAEEWRKKLPPEMGPLPRAWSK